jgi:hypothetical protein
MEGVDIRTETANHSNWLKINLPYPGDEKTRAFFLNEDGGVIKSVKLFEGNNAIDLSQMDGAWLHLKIETPYETILKKVLLPAG